MSELLLYLSGAAAALVGAALSIVASGYLFAIGVQLAGGLS